MPGQPSFRERNADPLPTGWEIFRSQPKLEITRDTWELSPRTDLSHLQAGSAGGSFFSNPRALESPYLNEKSGAKTPPLAPPMSRKSAKAGALAGHPRQAIACGSLSA